MGMCGWSTYRREEEKRDVSADASAFCSVLFDSVAKSWFGNQSAPTAKANGDVVGLVRLTDEVVDLPGSGRRGKSLGASLGVVVRPPQDWGNTATKNHMLSIVR
jgi:hypothetical protein